MQQPEVHLHPRAQAALGTFFSGLVKEGSRSFVIETHSDFLIDRVRQEIAAKTLPADHVGILFFERDGLKTTIHDLRLDEQGNVLNTPPGYRRFFMEEEMRLLTRGKAR